MKKPSEIEELEVKFSRIIPFPGYYAMTFFRKIFVRKSNKTKWEENEKTDIIML